MRSVPRLQLASIALVVAAGLCAELAALALSHYPSSTLLWWLNLEVFAPVSAIYNQLAGTVNWTLTTALATLLGILALSVLAFALRLRLVLASFSHVAFAACGLAAFAWLQSGPPTRVASLGGVVATFDSAGALLLFLLAGTLLGCVLTHVSYLYEATRRLRR